MVDKQIERIPKGVKNRRKLQKCLRNEQLDREVYELSVPLFGKIPVWLNHERLKDNRQYIYTHIPTRYTM